MASEPCGPLARRDWRSIASRCAAAEPEVDSPLPPAEAARSMIVPPGFRVTLFAGEPDVCQPIGFCFDDRGRLWVAEAYNYPVHGSRPGDRILIFEDVDGDGTFDRRAVFYDQLNYVTGLEVGFGGVWVVSPPSLYFIPDRDGDDRPDGPPVTLLDGFGTHANSHNLANALAWGPDGWLYGTHGRTNWSMIGKPGTPEPQRIRFDGGVYRFHPVRHQWEAFADGTTNPWGIDWNDYGEAFLCNCVNPHLFHAIQGAHYEPWRNRQSSQFAFERIASIADHLHFVGEANVRDGLGSPEEDEAGGGHAHCGTMVYLGDNWPAEYRNTVFMHNIHGKRINNDIPRRIGSGYAASHGKDLMRARDPWFMGVTLQYGPDGAVYSADWSDTGECHSVRNTRRQTGRIYKIAYGQPRADFKPAPACGDVELVELQLHANDWHVRHARRVLQERFAAGRDLSAARARLRALFTSHPETPRKLRALWTLHVIGGADDAFLVGLLDHADEHIRGWAVRLLCEDRAPPSTALARFPALAASDPSPYVRLQISSALQRLPYDRRWESLAGLLSRVEDETDPNLPLMNWYALEPLVDLDATRFLRLAFASRQSAARRHAARRAAGLERNESTLEAMAASLAESSTGAATARDTLDGLLLGLAGRRSAKPPKSWPAAFARWGRDADAAIVDTAEQVALVFNDAAALRQLRQHAASAAAEPARRERAVQALVAKRAEGTAELLLDVLSQPNAPSALQSAALRGLPEFNHPRTVDAILPLYPKLTPETRRDAILALAARPAWSLALLDAVADGRVPRGDLTAFAARQIASLRDPAVSERLRRVWGELRTTPSDRARTIADLRKRLTPTTLKAGDRSAGRVLFQTHCASCHRLFDAGQAVGPDLTGAQRFNLDYLLENLVDPSAAVSRDFQMLVIETESGRTLSGIAASETTAALTLQTANQKVVIPRGEIARRTLSPLSLMPEGLLEKLAFEQTRDLIAYLSGPGQVALPAPAGERRTKPRRRSKAPR
jgi:putative membrane-bound dehydrogenase-like protein